MMTQMIPICYDYKHFAFEKLHSEYDDDVDDDDHGEQEEDDGDLLPVRKDALLGPHKAVWQKALSKTRLLSASLCQINNYHNHNDYHKVYRNTL